MKISVTLSIKKHNYDGIIKVKVILFEIKLNQRWKEFTHYDTSQKFYKDETKRLTNELTS